MGSSKKLYMIVFVFILINIVYSERIRLSGLINPESLQIDSNNIYIADGASVNIFSKKEFNLIKKFGKRGDGPKEFALFNDRGIRIYLTKKRILVNSVMKLSFWTKKGAFIRSIKPKKFSALYIPIGEHYIGSGRAVDNKARYKTVNLYKKSLEPFKEIMRSKEPFQPGIGLSIASHNYIFEVGENQIYTCNSNDFKIEVFDKNGVKIKDIKREFKNIKITERYKKLIINYLKTDPKFKDIYNMLKPISFGDYFPAIDGIKYDNGKLYIMSGTGKMIQEIIVLRKDGTYIKKLKVPMAYKNVLKQLYPFVIKNGKLYQLVEDIEDEEWDLIIFDLKKY